MKMRKKLLVIFILALFIIISKSNIYARYVVSTGELLTYIDAKSGEQGKLKKSFYKEKKSNDKNDKQSVNTNLLSGDKWNSTQTNSFFIMGIWKEKLDNNEAFCLDPGKSIDKSGYVTIDKNYEEKYFDELDSRRKMQAIIYNANFSNITIPFFCDQKNNNKIHSITLSNDNQYILKQILFWASENNYLYSESGNFLNKTFDNIGTYGYKLLYEDIALAYLHYMQAKVPSTYMNFNYFANVSTGIHLNELRTIEISFSNENGVFDKIKSALSESYAILNGRYNSDDNKISITEFTPASGDTEEFQRFVSIYVPGVSSNPPDPVVQKKYYATGISLDGGNTIYSIDQNFTDMKESNQSIIRPDKSSDYVYQGFSLYGSNSAEKPSSILPTGGVTVQYGDTTCNLDYNAATNNYYLVMFIYKPKTYTVTYNYYCKSASESEYRYIGSGTPETHQRNANVSIPKTYPYDSTYNTTLYNTYSISTTVSNLSTAGDYINFDMPASDVTVNIYYQYGQVIKKVYIRNNDGTDTPVDSPVTKDLTSDQIIGIPSNIDFEGGNYGYFIYEQNGSKEYLPTSGNKTISKGKNNVTINLYYARRVLEHQHTLKVGNSSHRVLETRRN